MRKRVYLSKYFPFLLLFLHSHGFEFPSGVTALLTKYYHIKRSNEKTQRARESNGHHSLAVGTALPLVREKGSPP